MASGPETFSSRGSTLWPALADEDLSLSSSTASSSVSTCSVTTQRLLLPNAATSHMNDLSTFLVSSSAGSGAPTAAPHTFLDDLLCDEGDNQQLLQGQDGAASSEMTDSGMLSDAAFLSLAEDHTERDHETSYSSSSSVTSPSTGGTPIAAGSSSSTTRLLQLETNYERKKKRAKINRKDLNSRFQELMEILHLKEDRKLNRAKILEKAIEHIEKLTEEVNALKGGQQSSQKQVQARKTSVALHRPQQFHMMPNAMNQRTIVGSRLNKSRGVTPLLPFDPSQSHPWNAPAGTNLPLAPMMWVPCSMVAPSGMMLKRPEPERSADYTSRKRGRVENVEEGPRTRSVSTTTSSNIEGTLVTTVPSSIKDASLFVWTAQEIPTLLAFCDAWMLVVVMRTSRELRRASQTRKLWEDLCRARWRIPRAINFPQPREQWQQWHCANRIPDCSEVTPGGFYFASGRAKGISVWGLLSRRSNGHTTRTVLVKGKATVMQVVELYLVVQNLSHGRVRATDSISVSSTSGGDTPLFQPFTARSGAHLMPQVVAFNTEPCASQDVAAVVLQHGDLSVLSVFIECPGLDLEDQFLQRASSLNVQFVLDTSGGVLEHVNVHASCQDYGNYGRTQEKAMLATRLEPSRA